MTLQPNPRGSQALPRRPITPILIPIGVLVCMLALIAWSAWPVLRPMRVIQVEQAIVTPTSGPGESALATTPEAAQARTTRVVQAAGWLEANPYSIAASALADGVIRDMLVLEGDRVEEGQVLARMVDEDARLRLAHADAALESARGSLELEQAALSSAERNWEAPFELERAVTSGQAQLQERQAELAQLPALVRTEQSLLLKAQEELKSVELAYENDAASEIEFISARELVNAQDARLEATRAREHILRASVAQIESDLRAARMALELRINDHERLDSARARVRTARAEVQRLQTIRDEAQLELDRMEIRAPISGIVQSRMKSPGDKVIRAMDDPYSAHIVHLYDPRMLQVRVDVPLADASQVYVGQMCEVVVEVLPDRTFRGEVSIVTHQADLQKNTLQVKVRVLDPDPMLRPEMLTRVKFIPGNAVSSRIETSESDRTRTVRVPVGAIDSRSGVPRVWFVSDRANGRGVLRPVSVRVISEANEWATIESDLYPGAVIAAEPARCAPGERVRIASTEGGTR